MARRLLANMNMKSAFSIELPRMPEGVPGRIVAVEAAALERERLEALGLCVGRTVEVVQPGDPMIVRVLGTRLGLAAALARFIRVETA
jgi:ferrous iron transport protein A